MEKYQKIVDSLGLLFDTKREAELLDVFQRKIFLDEKKEEYDKAEKWLRDQYLIEENPQLREIIICILQETMRFDKYYRDTFPDVFGGN